ncbi:unnamed protein product [Mytilus coruscus]|uniref:C1q domain-containing protein n=1 Tax=Mytilus coruscus TaxID=42192 RepID=A0A6J8CZY4_MYTCO|nr:unnamed protein product [Mytilus coruscus]
MKLEHQSSLSISCPAISIRTMSVLPLVIVILCITPLCLSSGETSMTDQHYLQLVNMIASEMSSRTKLYETVTSLKRKVADIARTAKIDTDICKSQLLVVKNDSDVLGSKLQILEDEYNRLKSENSELLEHQSILVENRIQMQNMTDEQTETIRHLQSTLEKITMDHNMLTEHFKNVSTDYNTLLSDYTGLKRKYETDLGVFEAEMRANTEEQEEMRGNVTQLHEEMKITNATVLNLMQASETRKSEIFTLLNLTGDATQRISILETLKEVLVPKLSTLIANQDAMKNKIESQTDILSAKVALSACATEQHISGMVRFPNIKTAIGIKNLTEFEKSGNFVCEIPGLYLVSVYLVSTTTHANFNMYKNSHDLTKVFIKGISKDNRDYGTGTAVQAVELNVGDKIYVKLEDQYKIEGNSSSCTTIMKIK